MSDSSHESSEEQGQSDEISLRELEFLTRGRKQKCSVSSGSIVVSREEVDDGVYKGLKPVARICATSYIVEEGSDRAQRPVTFVFNGGPGSSSAWLHLGIFGPRRVTMGDAGNYIPPPYGVTDNDETLLGVTDLVFIDPVSTGWSRPVPGQTLRDSSGYADDIESVSEFIRLWTTRNTRWMSPKFIAGESYGTTRAAAVADHLHQRYSMTLNGLILISCALDFGILNFGYRNDRAHVCYLPTYAATAAYHGKVDFPDVRTAIEAAETYTLEYAGLLAQGDRIGQEDFYDACQRLAQLTGVSASLYSAKKLRILPGEFGVELLKEKGGAVGRLDSRVVGFESVDASKWADNDPSYHAISGPFASAWHQYSRLELGVTSEHPFELLSSEVESRWSFKEFEGMPIDVTPRLEHAMLCNPHLRVYIGSGVFDAAIPYYGIEDMVAHLRLPDGYRRRFLMQNYYAGHMMYASDEVRRQQSEDLAEFIVGQ